MKIVRGPLSFPAANFPFSLAQSARPVSSLQPISLSLLLARAHPTPPTSHTCAKSDTNSPEPALLTCGPHPITVLRSQPRPARTPLQPLFLGVCAKDSPCRPRAMKGPPPYASASTTSIATQNPSSSRPGDDFVLPSSPSSLSSMSSSSAIYGDPLTSATPQ